VTNRVLVVEDEWVIAEDHAQTLRDASHEVVGPCPSVRTALNLIDKNHIDVAVLDVQLQNEKSFVIAERLRQIGVPFVLLSGHDERVLPPEWHGTQMLCKPVEPGVLLAAVAALIERGAERR
jgi:DNA-binding response OmpR family regulator